MQISYPEISSSRMLAMRWVACCIVVLTLLSCNPGTSQLRTVEYTPTTAVIPNPERGVFIGVETVVGDRPLTPDQLARYRAANVTLLNRYYYLTPHVSGPISRQNLDFITRDMQTIRAAGMKTILKFAYNKDPRNPVDAEISVMLQHLEQLKPVFRQNKDVITAVQAGFIGSWGEWAFSSRGYQDSARVQGLLVRKILEVLPPDRMVCVRAMRHKFSMFGREALPADLAFNASDRARVGFHNDGFLKSRDDAGTFLISKYESDTGVTRKYLAEETRFVLMGGETSGPSARTNCSTALDELRRFHYSYLNRMFERQAIESFRRGGCWDEIERRLGYRFALKRGEFPASAPRGGSFRIKLSLVNDGFAVPYNPRPVEIVARHVSSGKTFVARLPHDPRTWVPGSVAVIDTFIAVPKSLPQGSYRLFLNLPDPESTISANPAYSIRLANESVWEPSTGYNDLKTEISITQPREEANRGIPLIPSTKPPRGK